MILGSIGEWILGNTFPFLVFGAYGMFIDSNVPSKASQALTSASRWLLAQLRCDSHPQHWRVWPLLHRIRLCDRSVGRPRRCRLCSVFRILSTCYGHPVPDLCSRNIEDQCMLCYHRVGADDCVCFTRCCLLADCARQCIYCTQLFDCEFFLGFRSPSDKFLCTDEVFVLGRWCNGICVFCGSLVAADCIDPRISRLSPQHSSR